MNLQTNPILTIFPTLQLGTWLKRFPNPTRLGLDLISNIQIFFSSQLVFSFYHATCKRYFQHMYSINWCKKSGNSCPSPLHNLQVVFSNTSFLITMVLFIITQSCGWNFLLAWHNSVCKMGNWTHKCLICFTFWCWC